MVTWLISGVSFLILRSHLVWFFVAQGKLVSSVSAAFRMGGGSEAVGPNA